MSTNETFARYRIGGRLGQGGMADVHEASLEGHDGFVRKVALKRMRAELARDPEIVRMFSDEARIASHLHHANLVSVLDFGVHEGVPFQALELVDGASLEALEERCRRDGLAIPEELAIHVAREIAHGLAYAHRAKDESGRSLGLVHRDVSPANVLVSEGGDVKLADFGIAFAKKREVETAHGVLRGKPSYMAPEQATKGTLDARTDVFALGCTLHFALTGRSPLEGDAVLMKLLVGEPAPIDVRLSEDLRALIARALSPDRRDRFASAEAFAEELDAAYRRRSERDGRAALRAWVAPLVKRARDERARNETSSTTPATNAPTPSTSPRAAARGEEPPRSNTVVWVLTGIGTLIIGAIALELWSLMRPAPVVVTTTAVLATTSAPEPETAPELEATTERETDFVTTEAPDLVNDAEPVRVPVREAIPTPDVVPAPEAVVMPSTTATRTREEEAVVMGWARIVAGCDLARDGAIHIDGRSIGEHVPTARRLSAGSHDVVVETADGQRFDGTIEVTEFHTESRPVWFRACSN